MAESSGPVQQEEAAKTKEFHVVVNEIAAAEVRMDTGEAEVAKPPEVNLGGDVNPSASPKAALPMKKEAADLMALEKDVAGMGPGMDAFSAETENGAQCSPAKTKSAVKTADLIMPIRRAGGLLGLSAFAVLALLFAMRGWQMLTGQLPYVTSWKGLLHYLAPTVLSLLALLAFLRWAYRPFMQAVREGAAIPRAAWWGLLAVAWATVVSVITLGHVDHESLFVICGELKLEFIGIGVALLALGFAVRAKKPEPDMVRPSVWKRIWRAVRWPVKFVVVGLMVAITLPGFYEYWNSTPEFIWNAEESRLILRSDATSLDGFVPLFEKLQPVFVEFGYMTELQDVKALTVLTKIENLDLSDSSALEDLSPLEGMKTVRELDLGSCWRVTSVAPIRGMVALEVLKLTHGEPGSLVGLEELSVLPKLRELSLRGIEELETLDAIKAYPALRRLNLEYCVGLRDVSGILHMKEMEFIDLNQCVSLPAKAVSDLRKAMPGALFFLPEGGSSSP